MTMLINKENGEYGTFKDSKKAPIHRWFEYPAGYSPKLVYEKIKQFNLNANCTIFDPFLGCGTTCLAAKEHGVSCIGIEAHSFVADIAKAKLYWDYNFQKLEQEYSDIIFKWIYDKEVQKSAEENFYILPQLVKKCYSKNNLLNLLRIKLAIKKASHNVMNAAFFNLALTSTLRVSSTAGTGWPYIAPTKYHRKKTEKEAIEAFKRQYNLMVTDIKEVLKKTDKPGATRVIAGDARMLHDIAPDSIDLAITSPPYLNNFDYADRTRLETYFFGITNSWAEITAKYRDHLIVAATTQTKRTGFAPENCICKELRTVSPMLSAEIIKKVIELSEKRLQKGGKKSYDVMVAQYFNDMFPIIKNTFLYLREGGAFVLVLGDSAPYGVHIPTETYIGDLGKSIGFKRYEIEELRKRGGKWAKNPQRHSVILRESILTLIK